MFTNLQKMVENRTLIHLLRCSFYSLQYIIEFAFEMVSDFIKRMIYSNCYCRYSSKEGGCTLKNSVVSLPYKEVLQFVKKAATM